MVTSLLALRNRIRLVYGKASNKLLVDGRQVLFVPLTLNDIRKEDIAMYEVKEHSNGVIFSLDPSFTPGDESNILKPLPSTPTYFLSNCIKLGIQVESVVKHIDEYPGTNLSGIPLPNTPTTYTTYLIVLPDSLALKAEELLVYNTYIKSKNDEKRCKVLFVDKRTRRRKHTEELNRLIRQLCILYESVKSDIMLGMPIEKSVVEAEKEFGEKNGWVKSWEEMREVGMGEKGFL